ncbi:hypothetical protein [Rhodopseudomonas sp. RCAM05734]|uniref:hypothetical protein n=1 Tax=Rhodopseudomonas sp. RCAM05734 TaxID=3457549 RepID=UPI00404430B1
MTRALVRENGQPVTIRRYKGPAGPSRAFDDFPTVAFVRTYGAKELIGNITQGDQLAVTLVDSLAAALPITTSDRFVVNGKEFTIKHPAPRTVGGVLIALDIQCAG